MNHINLKSKLFILMLLGLTTLAADEKPKVNVKPKGGIVLRGSFLPR